MLALIVEDEPHWSSILASIAKKLGLDATTANNLSDAESLVTRGEFDVLLLDLHVEGPEGASLLQIVESREDLARKTILVTGFNLVGHALATRVPVLCKTDLRELVPEIRRITGLPPLEPS